jgi:uncharacterized protein (DUF2345 family)
MGQPIAFIGHKVHCPRCSGASGSSSAATAAKAAAASAQASGAPKAAPEAKPFDEQVVLFNEEKCVLAGMPYTVKLPSGELVRGVTDLEGRTAPPRPTDSRPSMSRPREANPI